MVDNFITQEMKYSKEEWNQTKIEGIHTGSKKDKQGNKNEIIYITFENYNDNKIFKEKLKEVSEEISDRICPYIHGKAFERFKYIDHLAWETRKRNKKTKIIMGKHDFLLLTKDKNDNQPWQNIPPRIINNLPEFNIGKLNENDKKEEMKQREERRRELENRNKNIKKQEEENKLRREREEIALFNRFNLNEKDEDMEDEYNDNIINMNSKCKHDITYNECEECSYTEEEIQKAEQKSKKMKTDL